MSEFQSLSRACGPTSGSTTRSVPISHSITGPLARSIGPGFTGGERGKALTNAGGLSGPPFGVHYKLSLLGLPPVAALEEWPLVGQPFSVFREVIFHLQHANTVCPMANPKDVLLLLPKNLQ